MKYDWSTFPKYEVGMSHSVYIDKVLEWVENHKAELREIRMNSNNISKMGIITEILGE